MIPKFRAWDKLNKGMCDVANIDFMTKVVELRHDIPFYFLPFSEVVLMQSTGLKDKNDVEIFDGDIVKLTEKTINGGIDTHTCKVFQSKSGAWRLEGHPDFSRKYMTKRELYSVKSRTEVIGNIWEDGEFTEVAE